MHARSRVAFRSVMLVLGAAKGALVWVTSPSGVDSNGQYVDISP